MPGKLKVRDDAYYITNRHVKRENVTQKNKIHGVLESDDRSHSKSTQSRKEEEVKDPGSVFVCLIITTKFNGSKMKTNNNGDREGTAMFVRDFFRSDFRRWKITM